MFSDTHEKLMDLTPEHKGTCNPFCQKKICTEFSFDPEFSIPPEFFDKDWLDNFDMCEPSDKSNNANWERSVA